MIYDDLDQDAPVYLLMIYAKARREDLSPEEKSTVRAIAAALKRAHRSSPKEEDA